MVALGTIALFGIFSEPAEDSASWMQDLLLSKVAGFGCLTLCLWLRRNWHVVENWFSWLDTERRGEGA